jgi:hypothetical protein
VTDEQLLITWAACDTDPQDAIANFRGTGSGRKWRLFAVACCRRIEHLLPDARSRHAVDLAEAHADAAVADSSLYAAWIEAKRAFEDLARASDMESPTSGPCAASAASWCALLTDGEKVELGCQAAFNAHQATANRVDEVYAQADLLRDVFGGQEPRVMLDPTWRTPTAVALAAQMYESRDFGAMPILADALQDAGCDSAEVLDHCRGPGPHVRGCWVVDLVLGKA